LSYGHSGIQYSRAIDSLFIMIFSCNLWTRFTRASGDLAPLAFIVAFIGRRWSLFWR
jgi:hypothetical protein